ncbi:MAG TPA: response regulator [Chthoniobacterales bacterium]|nr:response regulator [Chthoniobacterales bacterium]
MPAPQESPAGTAPSVLLIEEYDALAAAITSALKKFAPQHRTRVVESLGEAEAAAAESKPQLFVIDFDPPHPNAIEFLNRMGQAHPDARVLAIASGTSPKFASERYGPNAIQFVEKPFELADFGAAVQALLGPWTEASSGDSRGTLRDLNLRDLVPLACVSGATAVLEVAAGGERTGEIHFLDGHICHASTPGLSGNDALHEIMRWRNARGKEGERSVDAPCTIQGPWLHVFLEALRTAKPSAEELQAKVSEVSPREAPEPAKPAPKTGKKILVIDDTEMLLIFVEDSLALADPSLQIVTAFTGGEGARRAETMIPDLVLLDYSLPDLRGDQICERFLQNKTTARIPVVMMSGHVPEMMATAERCPNVVATIAKPFMSEALIQLVQETLARGPLPADPQREAAPGWTITDHPVGVASPEPKPVRPGTGKKPAKTPVSPKSPIKEVPEKAVVSALPPPAPVPQPMQEAMAEPAAASIPDSPVPASLAEVPEPIPEAAPPAPSPAPPVRDIRPAEPALFEPPSLSAVRPAKLAGPNAGAVVLNLGMEVISVQFTPRFQIGTIRARPSATTLSLTQFLTPTAAEDRWGAGFELGAVELDPAGRIGTMRVRPTRRPADSIRTQSGFDINDVKLVNEAACIQFTAGTSAPMTMQLAAVFKVAGVELSDRFEVAQLVLQPEGSRVRITLDPQPRGTTGTEFEIAGVRLDASGRVAEFVLSSLQADGPERRVHVA